MFCYSFVSVWARFALSCGLSGIGFEGPIDKRLEIGHRRDVFRQLSAGAITLQRNPASDVHAHRKKGNVPSVPVRPVNLSNRLFSGSG